jgi:hypothetical protein
VVISHVDCPFKPIFKWSFSKENAHYKSMGKSEARSVVKSISGTLERRHHAAIVVAAGIGHVWKGNWIVLGYLI